MAATNQEQEIGKGKKLAPRSPLAADSEGMKPKRTQGMKIIGIALILFVSVIFMVFNAILSAPPSDAQRTAAERNISMSDSSTIQSELIAAAEAMKRAEQPEQPQIPIVLSSDSRGSQVIVVQPPIQNSKRIARQRILSDEERQVAREYRQMRQQSLSSNSAIGGFSQIQSATQNSDSDSASSRNARSSQLMELYMESLAKAQGAGNTQGQEYITAQQAELNFLTQEAGERTPQGYSDQTRNHPLAAMELKAGAVIPGLLLVGVNSDLPGAVIGQVSENVYDTATGQFLLIPQGTRIMGVYDSNVSFGQKRVSIVWNRLIYPDGSSLNIAGSPGTDMAGYSGIKGKVDNHYGQLLSAALFTSIFVTAAEMAAPSDRENYGSGDSKTPKEILTETTGTTIANIGARLAERALDIAPTILIKPGSRFNVMVQQDVIFTTTWNPARTGVSGF